MARGNKIVIAVEAKGVYHEGFIGASITPKPGTIMVIDPSVALKGGRHTWKLFDGADGEHPAGPFIVLREDELQGRTTETAYAAGDRAFGYTPPPGEEINLRLKDISGTGDDHALGEKLMVDGGTGLMIATTGSPECEPAMLLEVVTDPTTDTLAWCIWSGM